jgi:hypothetical protein
MMMRWVWTFGLWVMLASPSWAATYYIDYVGGADTNVGTSTGAAWKHAPGMTGCASNCNITSSAGDIYYFKAGVTWPASTLPIQPNASGSAGNTITYAKASAWGTGDYFILDGAGTAIRCIGSDNLDDRQYITFDGFHCTDFASNALWTYGIVRARNYPNLVIQNCKIETTGVNMLVSVNGWRADMINCILDGTNATGTDGVGTWQLGTTDLNNSIGHGSIIRGNNVICGAKEYGFKIYNCKSCLIEKNYFHGYTNANGYLLVHRSSHGATFRYNVIEATSLSSVGIAFNMWHGSGSSPDPDSGNKIYNNTIIGDGLGVGMTVGSPNWDGHQIYNNIIYDMSIGIDSEGDFTATNNIIYSTPTLYNGGGARTLSGNITTNPTLTSTVVGNLPSGAAPLVGSPAINGGTAFDSYSGTDYAGTALNGTVDIGAYEYGAGSTSTGTISGSTRFTGSVRIQ